MQSNSNSDPVFVIECCTDTKPSQWHTRIDEKKYEDYFNKVSAAIRERIPNAVTVRNQIPKEYLPYDLYCNLIPNNNPDSAVFQQVPRLYSFEVSYKGLLIFSKLLGGYWPNVQLVADKAANIMSAEANGEDTVPYLASGSAGKARGASPVKSSPVKKKKGETPAKQVSVQQAPAQEPPVKPFKLEESQKFLEPVEEPEKAAPIETKQQTQEATEEEPADTECGRHIKHINDLKGFPVFKAGEQGSQLCKYLTRDVWAQLKDKKDDSTGVSFKQCILSGCQNTDSGIGVYAASPGSYNAFAALFHPIIEDYHKIKISDGHSSNMDHTQLNCPPFPADEASMINSTRIRVGRNLAAYPLGPGISAQQRKEVEKLVTDALSKFDGDLKGTYYSLETMTAADQQQLIADHFLFKEGDRFLEACGLNREWPEGRGIFHNDAKTFLVWVNEEDQLRIISMEKGSDIGAVFSRLARAAAQIEKVAEFAHDKNLGYITSCPTNLGTALRASVHICLPYLSKDKARFQAIADKYHVQIRGAHGEHTETDDGIFDISNKRRLGRSEKDLVQDMYDGVKAMIAAEKELRPAEAAPAKAEAAPAKSDAAADVTCGSHLKTPEDLTGFPVFPEGQQKSSVARFNTRDVWEKLKDQVDEQGVSYKTCVFSGCQNTDSGIGCYAGSHKGYYQFAPLFDQVISDYHGHAPDAKHQSDMDYTKLNCPPFPEDEAAMIKSTRIRVGRNLAKFPLGPGISKEQRNQVETDAQEAFKAFTGELEGTYYALGNMSAADQKQLIADHFLFKEGDRFLEACGLNRNWPEGRGIFHNKDKTFLCWVNEEDQFRIISMQPGADIGAVFKRLSVAAAEIEKVAKFAHDDHLGYVTSCPTNLGTALRASVHIHLPLLAKNKDKFQAIADKFYVQIRGAHGEHTETDDGIFDISNRRRLGRSEKDLVQDMYDGVKAMIAAEKELAGGAAPAKEESKDAADVTCGSHLKAPEDLTGFPVFPEGQQKSSVARFNTREVWNELKDKVDEQGVSYKTCIFSGCQNTDSGIGCYAGSHKGYYQFASLFDQVISDYHGHGKDAKHQSNMDYTQLNCPPFPEDEAAMIKSTRIRVGRNLAKFPLGPGISKEQRNQVETDAQEAFKNFTGELEGQYYALGSMSEADRAQLVADHFLFKQGDRFLEACGLNRNWPEGRGIFHNKDKTFLCWVNEEDQFRIISMQPGADIGAVFKRLSVAAAEIEKVAEFAHDDHLGYVTSCPTNLGTALRASVHIHLPLLAKNKDKFQAIADKYYVQIRGAHGEHTETDDGIFDISNRRRLGRSEKDLVQDMYDGVKAMIAAEKELAAAAQ